MSWQATAWAKKIRVCPNGEDITMSEKFLLLILADYYNDQWQVATASMTTLAENALMDERSVRRNVRRLEAKGLIAVARGGGTVPNGYAIPALAETRPPQRGQFAPGRGDKMSVVTGDNTPPQTGDNLPPVGGTFQRLRGDISGPCKENSIKEQEDYKSPLRGTLSKKDSRTSDKNPRGFGAAEFEIKAGHAARFEPLVKMAVEIGSNDPVAQQRLAQWVLSMIRTLNNEPEERTAAVVRLSLEAVKRKLAEGYTIKSLWGLLTVIFDRERTRFMQTVENEAHKHGPIAPAVKSLLQGIG